MPDATQTETASLTPEQLLQTLSAQLAMERCKRAGRPRRRAMMLACGVLFILFTLGVALLIAQQMIGDLRERGVLNAPKSAKAPSRGNF